MLELTALLLSAAALVVSCAALYLTTLRPTDIEVDYVEGPSELTTTGFSGAEITGHVLQLTVFLSNVGARGGLLEDVHVDDLNGTVEESPSGPRFKRRT